LFEIEACLGDDPLEDNDDYDTALPIGAGYFPGLWVCCMDQDIYAIDLAAGDEITVDILFAHAEGNIDLILESAPNYVAVSSYSEDDNETITYTVTEAGTYYIVVEFVQDFGSYGGNGYDMVIGGCSGDDAYEENDDVPEATPVFAGSYPDLIACWPDLDIYVIGLDAGEALTVDLWFSNDGGNIDLQLYDPNITLVDSAFSLDDNETLTYTATLSGLHYIVAFLLIDYGAFGNPYSMDLAVAVDCIDADGDGYGDPASPECAYPQEDCDDTNPYVNPGMQGQDCLEFPDGVDNDCDGQIDEDQCQGTCFMDTVM
jgi:hypothetical protein